jgi:type I restriction enzyme S subunit
MSRSSEARLGEICESISYGVTASAVFGNIDGPQLLRITDITETGVRWELVPECRISDSEERAALLRSGDIVVARTGGTVGKSFLVANPPRAVNASYLLRLRPNLAIVVPEYLHLFMGSGAYWAQLNDAARGAAQPNVNATTLSTISIPLPDITKQNKLVVCLKARLTEVENARLAAEVQLQDTGLLGTRLLAEVFNRLDSAETKVLGDYAVTTSGSTPSRGLKRYWEPAEIPWVKTGEVNFSTIRATKESVSRTALVECSLMLLPPKTVLVAMYGQGKTRGQSAMLDIEATTNQACFAILPNHTWEPEFLYYWLMASYQDLRNLSENRGGNQANLNGALLNNLKVPAPDQKVQLRIVQEIKAALSEIEALESQSRTILADIEQLPNRILAQAFEN